MLSGHAARLTRRRRRGLIVGPHDEPARPGKDRLQPADNAHLTCCLAQLPAVADPDGDGREVVDEAALIDGAGYFTRLFNVTIPMISPVIYFNVVLSIIAGFQAFTQAFIMTGSTGAPQRSTLFYVLNLYNVGFQDLRMGYASAMAWVLFIVILVLTFAATKLSQRWVTYDR